MRCVADIELLAGIPAEGAYTVLRSANIHGTALDLDPEASERDVVVYTFLTGSEDPVFSVLNRDHWQPRGVGMVEWMAESALADLSERELREIAGHHDPYEALYDIARAAGRGEAPWVPGRLKVRGREVPAESLVLNTAGMRFEIGDVGDRMVAVANKDVAGAPDLGELALFSRLDPIWAQQGST